MLHQKIFVPYILLCTARLSVSHWNFSTNVNSCFRQRKGSFFHRHTYIHLLHSFSLYNALYTLIMRGDWLWQTELSRLMTKPNKTASHARCPATAVISSKWQISHVKSKESCFSLLFSNINNSDTCICNNHNEVLYMFLLTISFCVKLGS